MRRARTLTLVVLALAASLSLSACGEIDDLLGLLGSDDGDVGELLDATPAASTVLAEPAGDAGPNPFTDRAAPEPDEVLRLFAEQGAPIPDGEEISDPTEALVEEDGYFAIEGGTPGLFGGTNEEGSCDADQVAAFLAEEPEKAGAWAEVLGITPEGIADYLDDTTAVQLGADTRVLNHGFADGEATPREAVLQRSSSVLVDDTGVPVVRCECGNPLLPPTVTPDEVIEGETWENFREGEVLVIEPAPEMIEAFEVTDVEEGTRRERPRGSSGADDRPVTPAAEVDQQAEPERDTAPDGEVCGEILTGREETVMYFVRISAGEMDCHEARVLAHAYASEHLGDSVDIDGWQCDPANARMMEEGIAGVCRRGDVVIDLLFDSDDFEVGGPAETEEPDDGPQDPSMAVPEECGTISGDLGMLNDLTAGTDGFGLLVRGAEPCEIAEEVATAFLLDFSEWLVTDGDLNALPYETDVLGWECSSGPLLNPAIAGFPGCTIHNAEIELTPPG